MAKRHSCWGFLLFAWAAFAPRGADAEWFSIQFNHPADRAAAADMLGRMQVRSAVPLLIELCSDGDGGVRESAIDALAQMKEPRAVTTLERIAADPRAESIGGASNIRCYPFLGGDMPVSRDYNVRRAAQVALTRIPDAQGKPREALEAIKALTAIDHAVFRRLGAQLDRSRGQPDNYWKHLQTPAGREYQRICALIYQIQDAPGPKGTAALASVLTCGDMEFETSAANALCDHRAEDVLPKIRALLTADTLSDLSLSCCLEVLLAHDKKSARKVALQVIERLKTSVNPRRFSNRELSRLRLALEPDGAGELEALREAHADAYIRGQLDTWIEIAKNDRKLRNVWANDRIPEAELADAVPLLRAILRDPQDERQWNAAYLLGRHQVKSAVPELMTQLSRDAGETFDLRLTYNERPTTPSMTAAWALAEIADPDCIPALRSLAIDRERPSHVRTPAILAYASLAARGGVDALQGIFHEDDPLLRPDDAYWEERGQFRVNSVFRVEDVRTTTPFSYIYSLREAAATGLALAGGEPARQAVAEYLKADKPVTRYLVKAASQLDRPALEAWSREKCRSPQPTLTAIDTRLLHFPQTSGAILQAILARDNEHSMYLINRLQEVQLGDDRVTRELIRRLAGSETSAACNRQIAIIHALGRQGGKDAEAALIEYARTGKFERDRHMLP
jgi:HEAT repeat protein